MMSSHRINYLKKALNNPIGIWYNDIGLKGEEISWICTCIYTVRRRKT